MTSPLDEKGHDASTQALLNAFPMADKIAAMYAEVAIGAYLSHVNKSPETEHIDTDVLSPAPDGLEVCIDAVSMLEELTKPNAEGAVHEDVIRGKAAFYARVLRELMRRLETAEAQVKRLTEDNEALRAELTKPDAERRQWFIGDTLGRKGFINRADIVVAFGISVPQASTDIQAWLAANPGKATYNTSTKRYEGATLNSREKVE